MGSRYLTLIGALAILLSACATTGPEVTTPSVVSEVDLSNIKPNESRDSAFKRIAKAEPDFGGMYREDGKVYIFVKDLDKKLSSQAVSTRSEMVSSLTKVLGEGMVLGRGTALNQQSYAEKVELLPAQYNYDELTDWFDLLRGPTDLGQFSNVVYVDLDEGRNRIVVGVLRGSSANKIYQEVDRSQVPREAVVTEETEPAREIATLRSMQKNMVGGVQIYTESGSTKPLVCSAGFNAIRNGVRGMVIASHCTGNSTAAGGVESRRVLETCEPGEGCIPVRVEVFDPKYKSCTSPSGSKVWCRKSDTAFIKYDSRLPSSFAIAHTGLTRRAVGGSWGSITMPTLGSRFKVGYMGLRSRIERGMILDKVGRTTGWTAGKVVAVCLDGYSTTVIGNYRRYYPCSNAFNGGASGGDSGAPVFKYLDGPEVSLFGIAFTSTGSSVTWFNDMSAIQSEMGALTIK